MAILREFICPYCFDKILTRDIEHRCGNTRCPGLAEDPLLTGYRSFKSAAGAAAPKYPPVLEWKPRGFWEKITGGANPYKRRAVCPSCNIRSFVMICPRCHNELPGTAGKMKENIIAVIGDKNSGKSNYIAALVHRLRGDLGADFNWGLIGLGNTLPRYERVMFGPLFQKNPPEPVAKTSTADVDSSTREPMIFQMAQQGGQCVTLVFFDTAGEEFADKNNMAIVTRYLANAVGIILLLDPLQLPDVRRQLQQMDPQMKMPPLDLEWKGILDKTIETIKSINNNDSAIPIPIVPTFSKIDLLLSPAAGERFFPPDAQIRYASDHRGFLDIDDFNSVSQEMKGLLASQSDVGAMLLNHTENFFSTSAFYGVSALGANPFGLPARLPGPVTPYRVEEPFLWLMWRNGLITGKSRGKAVKAK